ncbi:response regulator transcription factor [Polaribacter sp. Hel_I_88]|uniref:response regulator transcription factor n=1 Tax=Polaribacter sp. Hel_I_88 TaxID=1250006 RepID=UPI00047E6FB2|nr:response regulator transcription factor [Polaribacter sp. Hel_I_88]
MIKIVITDDHELFRVGLSELLKKQEDIEVVAELSNGKEFLDFIAKKPAIDIVLLDITMPIVDGFEVLDALTKNKSTIKPIMVSMFDDGNYIAKCAKNGAYSYLLKNTDEFELLKAIRIVAKGKKYFNQAISEKMINFMSTQHTSIKKLSNKESEILILIGKGLTTKDIASKLFISTRTVETHRANILKKLEVKNTASLIKKATENNLL